MTAFYEVKNWYHYTNDEGPHTNETKPESTDFFSIKGESPSEYIERMTKVHGYRLTDVDENCATFSKDDDNEGYDEDGIIHVYYHTIETYFYSPINIGDLNDS